MIKVKLTVYDVNMEENKNKPLSINQIINIMLDPEHRIDPKIVKFIHSYVECRHIKEAEKVAGLSSGQGKRILNKSDVQACMLKINETLGKEASFDSRELLERANEVAQFDIIDVFLDDGRVKDVKDIPPAARRAVKKIVVREVYEKDMNGMDVFSGYIKTIEFWDKIRSLELIGKYDGVFREKVEHSHDVTGNLASLLLNSEKRALTHQATETIKMTKDPYLNSYAAQASTVIVKDED